MNKIDSNVRKIYVKDVLPLLKKGYIIEGSPSRKYFRRLKPIFNAEADALVFADARRRDKQRLIEQTKAEIIICDKTVKFSKKMCQKKCFLKVDDPKLTFMIIGNTFFKKNLEFGVHPSAYVSPTAKINKKTYIGPFSYIGKCKIGKNTIIHGHCHICDDVMIGDNVTIFPGCIIGSDSFGYIKNENGVYENFLHIGGVVIEDGVEIGANCCVSKGSLGNTIIKEGAKIGDMVYIAHNVVIGKSCLVTVNVTLSGSVTIGDNVWISPGVVIKDNLTINNNAFLGTGAVVTKDVPPNEKWVGVPAEPLEYFIKLRREIRKFYVKPGR